MKMYGTARKFIGPLVVLLSSIISWAAPLGPTVRAVIPTDVLQVISVNYRIAKTFDAAMTLKAQVLPDNLKEFETALSGVGIDTSRDIDSLTFATIDTGKEWPEMVAMVSGSFSPKIVLTRILLQKVQPIKYHGTTLYPASKTLAMTLLDDGTVLLGNQAALQKGLDVRAGRTPNLASNKDLSERMKSVEKATAWMILDQKWSQTMLASALGDLAKMPEFAKIRERVLGSCLSANFRNGLRFDMDVLTVDTATAAKLQALLKAGLLFKKVTANPEQRSALDSVKVTSDRVKPDSTIGDLKMKFRADQREFQRLLMSRCFTDVRKNERKELSGITAEKVKDEPVVAEKLDQKPQVK